jgi:uncharacterized membrane protein YraQ (UPF0718 family)
VAAIALGCACVWTPPDALRELSGLVADWASIILAALPYIVAGALAAYCTRRFIVRRFRHSHQAIAFLTVLNPGCDCALNGFASELTRLHPALAGFALTFAAAASPVSLAITYAVFGTHMTIVRAAGALLAAALTSAAWSVLSVVPTNSVVPTFMVGCDLLKYTRESFACPADHKGRHYREKNEGERCSPYHNEIRPTIKVGTTLVDRQIDVDDLAAALRGVAYAATAAVAIKAFVPISLFAHMAPASAALLGALLSPCSTADPLMAAAFMRSAHAQLAFMLAAQCLDVRQMFLMLRHFGRSRMIAAAVCAACACAAATQFA